MHSVLWRKLAWLATASALLAAIVVPGALSQSRGGVPLSPGNWSPVVQGLRGRLIATATQDDKGRPQIRFELELENVLDLAQPMEIWWNNLNISPMLDLSLEDEAGMVLPKEPYSPPISGNFGMPFYWLDLPSATSMRSTISSGAYVYHRDGYLLALRPFVLNKGWDLPLPRKSKLYLRGKLVSMVAEGTEKPHSIVSGATSHPWFGTLDLPRIELP